MATPQKTGSDEPIFQHWEQRWTLPNGLRSTNEWQGINLAKISALAQQYYNLGQNGTLRFEKNIATLTIETSDGSVNENGHVNPFQTILDRWEVGVDEEQPSLFENQNFLNYAQSQDNSWGGIKVSSQLISVISSTANSETPNYAIFSKNLNDALLYKDNGDEYDGTTKLNDVFNGVLSNLQPFIMDYLRGATNFVHSKYVLKHTTIAPNNYASNVADFNVEKIYTISQLLTEAQNNSIWLLPLPAYLAYKINAYPVPVSLPFNFQFGALKLRSNAITAARGRIEIEQNYLIDSWPKHTYGLAS